MPSITAGPGAPPLTVSGPLGPIITYPTFSISGTDRLGLITATLPDGGNTSGWIKKRAGRWGTCPTLLLLALVWTLAAERRGPGDVASMNRFATEYNRYAAELHEGVVDVKQWGRVEKAWEAVR
jgi:hypothetical protein